MQMKAKTSLLAITCLSLLTSSVMGIVHSQHLSNKKFLSQVEAKGHASNYITYGGYSYDNNTSNPAADFIFGILLIVMSFPVLWNNERKQVKIYNLLVKGQKECSDADFKKPLNE